MVYENPDEYNSEQDRREKMLKKALDFAKLKKTKDEPTNLSSEEIVEAAKKFDDFLTGS